MRIHKLSIDGKEIIFINNCRSCPSGFVHETDLFIDGWQAADARCYYINRTWERYAYQSVMLEAVHKLQEWEMEREKCRFRQQNGIKNIMERHKSALEDQLKNNEDLLLYKKIEGALR